MSEKTVEREMKEVEQERLSQSNHPGGATIIRDTTTAGSSNQKGHSSTTSANSQTSFSKESSRKELIPNYMPSFTLPITMFYETVFTQEFIEDLDVDKISKSDEELVLFSVECERIQDTISLIKKAVLRYKTIEKARIEHLLDEISTHSIQTSDDKEKDTKLKIKEVLDKSRMRLNKTVENIRQSLQTCRRIDNHDSMKKLDMVFELYFKMVIAAKSKRKRQFRKGKNYKKKLNLVNKRDLDTRSDLGIAQLLSALLNTSENILLPTLRKLGVLPNRDLPSKIYNCRKTPESIREHMAILKELLSDSKDLKYKTEYKYNFINFLVKSRKLLDDCVFLHNKLRSMYSASLESIKKLGEASRPVTKEEYRKMADDYFKVRIQHNAVKNMARKCLCGDQRRLKTVSRCFLEFIDEVALEHRLLAILNIFAWLPTVSKMYCNFIEDDGKHLNVCKKILSSLVHSFKNK